MVSNNQVNLVWQVPNNNGASQIIEYRVYRGSSSGGPYAFIGSSSTLEYKDTAVINDNTYYYVVSAVNSFGESDYSNEIIATPSSTFTISEDTTTSIPDLTFEFSPGWSIILILGTLMVIKIGWKRQK